MALYGLYGNNNRRSQGRAKRELNVVLRGSKEAKTVYTVDFSTGGVKVGAAMLRLALGEPVEFVMENNGNKMSFLGRVTRDDGLERINRIGRDANTFFIRIGDAKFAEFVHGTFSI